MVNSDYKEYVGYHIHELREKYAVYRTMKNDDLFSLLCIKYFFFNEEDIPFDADMALEYFTDGPNDGGIDAIFNDPNSDDNDIIIMQCKNYNKSSLRPEEISAAILKIQNTLNELQKNKISSFNSRLVEAYRDATANSGDNGTIRIYFFTMYQPSNKRISNKIEKQFQTFPYEVEFIYGKDIEDQIEICDNGKTCVESDKLIIDSKNNILHFGGSVIVNISAKSLAGLYNKRKNGLLGMNLRYYVRQKSVDLGIQRTIQNEPNYFWYKNNGIVIFCEDFWIDGNELKLQNFSIINGGQTTNQISRLEIDKDFYLLCKVIKAPTGEKNKEQFAFEIAEASNSQKPIKPGDLKANTPEQLNLRKQLRKYHVWYITKKGDKASKEFNKQYEVPKISDVGKVGLSGILQLPGSSRNSGRKMYTKECYWSIFGNETKAGVIADLLKISYYYSEFLKTDLKELGYAEEIPIFKNSQTFQVASICLLSKILNQVFTYDQVSFLRHDHDELKKLLKKMSDMERILVNRSISENEERNLLYSIFNIIGNDVLWYCYSNEYDKQKEYHNEIVPSNYFKSDSNYFKDVIPQLWKKYNQNRELKECINKLCLKKEK